jgi:exodeoxyribonuclease VIII
MSGDRFAQVREAGGLLHGLSNEDYHQGPGLSVSGIKRFRRTPFHYHALAQPHDAPPTAPTPAMINGTLVHCLVLEPDQFFKRYVIGPDVDKRTREWKEFLRDSSAAGWEVISQVQFDAAERQANALRALPDVATLLGDGRAEVSAYWLVGGVLCKCRPDWVSPVAFGTGSILLDVKTTKDASPQAFARSAADLGYHLQADWYCEGYAQASGMDVHGMVFAVVESEYPHACALYMLDEPALDKGRAATRDALKHYTECVKADAWPSYSPEITTLQLPPWA